MSDDRENLYLGEMEIESTEGWWYGNPKYRPTHVGYGLQKMIHTGDSAFEMLAVRAAPDGFNIEFTAPAGAMAGDPAHYRIQQWRYEPAFTYGGPMLDVKTLHASGAVLSGDGKTVALVIPGLKADRVTHIQLREDMRSAAGKAPWTYEVWYTLNAVPGQGNGVRPSAGPDAAGAFSVARAGAGSLRIHVALREKYALQVADLRGNRMLAAQGSGPDQFVMGPALPDGIYVLTLKTGMRSYRRLIRSF